MLSSAIIEEGDIFCRDRGGYLGFGDRVVQQTCDEENTNRNKHMTFLGIHAVRESGAGNVFKDPTASDSGCVMAIAS